LRQISAYASANLLKGLKGNYLQYQYYTMDFSSATTRKEFKTHTMDEKWMKKFKFAHKILFRKITKFNKKNFNNKDCS